MTEWIQTWIQGELDLLDFISTLFAHPVLDAVLPVLTSLCNHGELWIVMALVMLCFARTRRMGAAVLLAMALGFLTGNLILKPLVARIRPYELRSVALLIPPLHDSSFPSGHTLASFEAAGVLMFMDKRFGVPALIVACMIAFSRLYLYVHYPTDVAAGIVIGVCFAFVAVRLTERAAASGIGTLLGKKVD